MRKKKPLGPLPPDDLALHKVRPGLFQSSPQAPGAAAPDPKTVPWPDPSLGPDAFMRTYKQSLSAYSPDDHQTHTAAWLKHMKEHYPESLVPDARLPTDSAKRKNIPLASGVLDYFPDALAAVAAVSKAGNDQHNPGEPLHWARGKSMDQGDTLIRHFLERGSVDVDGLRHSAKMAWRALALLQLEIEQEKGLPPSRGSR